MDEVTPWIKDYFLNLATTHGSNYNALPPVEKLRKCQLRKVLTSKPKDYYWVLLSDKEHEVPGRIPKEVAEQSVRETKRDEKFTKHRGSLIEIRDFSPLLIRVGDGPSTSSPRKVLALDIGKAKLRGAAQEPVWGSPQQLESVQDLKEWLHELRKPGGNQDILKVRKEQQGEAKVTKQSTELPQPLPDLAPRLKPKMHPPAAQWKVASTTPAIERSPMQHYRRKWKKAVPGLDEFARRLQLPEGVWLKISEKLADKEVKTNSRSSGMHPMNKPSSMRGALEIGSSPARLSSAPPPEQWSASPGMLRRLYNDHETEMSSDVDSSRLSSPVDAYHDAEMNDVEPQPELDTVPETPQVPPDSQTQNLSPPPPAQPPRPRSPLPSSSSNPQQIHPVSPSSIHTSVQAVSGSQLPSLDKPSVWAGLGDISSGGPDFLLPSPDRDDPHTPVSKLSLESHPSPGKPATEPMEEPAQPTTSKLPEENKTIAKEALRGPGFEETIGAAIERAFQESTPEVVSIVDDPPAISHVGQSPPPEPWSKSPSKAMQTSLLGPPSPLNRLTTPDHLQRPVRQPFQALNRKVPVPEVDPTRELVRGRNESGVLVPASDEIKLSLSSNQNSSQSVQPPQSIPSSHPLPQSALLPSSQPIPPSEPQTHHSASQPDKSIAQEGDSIIVQVDETVADIKAIQDLSGNTQGSLEHASTQEEGKVAAAAEPQKLVDKLTEAVAKVEKAATGPLQSPLPRIVAIREVESQQTVPEEIDELEGDSELDNRSPLAKRKSKPVRPKSSVKGLKPPRLSKQTKPSNPASLVDSAEKGPPGSSSKPPEPAVLIGRKRTLAVPTENKAPTPQKRRHTSPSEEGFPIPQPVKRSSNHGHRRPAKLTVPPIQRTRSPPPLERQNSGLSNIPRSAKGKGRAEGIKGLENIGTSKGTAKELETVQVKPKKAPDTGSKRKPSDAFSALDDSRDIKRQKVALEPEPRKLTKQLSFVDPDKLKRPFRSKPQIRKTSAQHETTSIIITEPSAVDEPDADLRTSKYFNPRLYREPEYPPVTATTEVQQPGKAITSGESVHGDRHHSENIRPRIDSRKMSTSNADRQLSGKSWKIFRTLDGESPVRSTGIQPREHGDNMERDSGPTGSRYPLARKLGSFTPDLNPPPLPGLPGGRLMNKKLRGILIRTGKVRTREARAAESGLNSR